MAEAQLPKLNVGLLLSKLDLSLSKTEAIESCKIYFKITSSKIIHDVLELELEPLQKNSQQNTTIHLVRFWLNRLALTKEAYLIVGNEFSEIKKNLKPPIFEEISKGKNIENASFKISTRNLSSSTGTQKDTHLTSISSLVNELNKVGFQKTNMTNPDFEFVILRLNHPETTEIIGLKLWKCVDNFESRRAHLRPVLHPTATNPRIARAMINMASSSKEILDPFCGAGGILLEASEIGLRATGVDIDPLMIKRAELNLKDHLEIELHVKDALSWNKKTECVVTDLPYGKSSKLEGEIAELLHNFLKHYATLTDKIVVCFPVGTKYNINPPWNVQYEFELYMHKSLTRKILVLKKN